ncbi:MAG TPA: hypothetical protein VL689_18525 [Paraburkholderia sp.]|jgi:hypothetical protein|nr:hypothetical protein [Paraburkholderia sp.]
MAYVLVHCGAIRTTDSGRRNRRTRANRMPIARAATLECRLRGRHGAVRSRFSALAYQRSLKNTFQSMTHSTPLRRRFAIASAHFLSFR